MPVDVDLWSTAVALPAGHRIGIHVSATDFPRLAVNPGTAATWAERDDAVPRAIGIRLHHDAERPSWVQLPDPERTQPPLPCGPDTSDTEVRWTGAGSSWP